MINWKQRRVTNSLLDHSVVEKIGLRLCDRLIKLITGIYIKTRITDTQSYHQTDQNGQLA